MKKIYTADAARMTRFTVDGDVRDELDNHDPEIITDKDLNEDFSTREDALAAARAWAAENPAHKDGYAVMHHMVSVFELTENEDGDYDTELVARFDTLDSYEA